jgi:hypothetical protein
MEKYSSSPVFETDPAKDINLSQKIRHISGKISRQMFPR